MLQNCNYWNQRRLPLIFFAIIGIFLLAEHKTPLAYAAATSSQSFRLDTKRSSARFELQSNLGSLTGRFLSFAGNLQTQGSGKEFAPTNIRLGIDISAVDVDPQTNFQALSPDVLFQAIPLPRLSFRSTSVRRINGNKFNVVGQVYRGQQKWDASFPAAIYRSPSGFVEMRADVAGAFLGNQSNLPIQAAGASGHVTCHLVFTP